jgi:hypothetical protein
MILAKRVKLANDADGRGTCRCVIGGFFAEFQDGIHAQPRAGVGGRKPQGME